MFPLEIQLEIPDFDFVLCYKVLQNTEKIITYFKL